MNGSSIRGPFSIGNWHKRTNADQRVSQANSRARDATWACLTSSYISPYNRTARQIPLFVHILCIVTCIAGHPESTSDFRWICSTSFSFLLCLAFSLFLSYFFYSLSVDPACLRSYSPASSFAFYFLLLLYSPNEGGWVGQDRVPAGWKPYWTVLWRTFDNVCTSLELLSFDTDSFLPASYSLHETEQRTRKEVVVVPPRYSDVG